MNDSCRKLGDLEYTYWLMDLASRTHFAVMAEMDGSNPITEDELSLALASVQALFPLLNVRIAHNERGQTLFEPSAQPVPVHMEDVGQLPAGTLIDRGDVVDHLNRSQRIRIDAQAGPLMRAHLLRHEDGLQTLILTFHHAISDGRSAMHVLRCVLDALDGKTPSWPLAMGYPADSGPMEQQIPPCHTGFYAHLRTAGYALKQSLHRMVFRPKSVPVSNPYWPDQRSDCFLIGRFSEKETARFITAAVREGAGVHAALCAAQLMSLGAEYPDKSSIRAWLLTLVDLRRRVEPPVNPETLNLMISMVEFCQSVKQTGDFWDLALRIKKKINKRLEQGFHFYALPVQARLIHRAERWIGATEKSSRAILRLGQLTRPLVMPVSNIGTVDVPVGYDHFRVRNMTFTVPLSSSGIWGSSVNTFGACLNWNFSYASPSIPKEQAVRMAQKSMDIIRTNLDPF